MKRLHPNTLEDIARHSNKLLKLVGWLAKSESSLFISSLAKLDRQTDPIELIKAFDKDLSTTAKSIFDTWTLAKTADPSHTVHHLNNPEKNLTKIFGDRYSESGRLIHFGGYDIELDKGYTVEAIKALVVKETIGVDFEFYQDLKAKMNVIFKDNDAALNTDADKIKYLSNQIEVVRYKDVIKSLREIANKFHLERKKMNQAERNYIDQEITFERAMIDSVVKTSTYVSKKLGTEQIFSRHKNQPEKIEKIKNLIDDSKIFEAIEIDQDSNLDAIIDALQQLEDILPNLPKDSVRAILKSRKLGNYNANGMYSEIANIIAADIKAPSSLVHELTHAIDFKNKEIRNSGARKMMVSSLRENMNLERMAESLNSKKVAYYNHGDEIIARMGEIGYLLNKFNYNANEPFEVFVERVRGAEASVTSPYDLNLVKPIDFYLEHKDIYFNLESMPKQTLSNIKNFSRVFFGVDGQAPEHANDFRHETAPTVYHGEKKPSAKYQHRSVSAFTGENIDFILDFNNEHKVVSPSTLAEHILTQITHIDRTTLAYPKAKRSSQQEVVNKMIEWAAKESIPTVKKAIINSLLNIGFYESRGRKTQETVDATSAKILKEGIKSGKRIVFDDIKKVYAEREEAAHQAFIEATKRLEELPIDTPQTERWRLIDLTNAAQKTWADFDRQAKSEFITSKRTELPEAMSLYYKRYEYWHAETTKKKTGYSKSHFIEAFRATTTAQVREFAINALNDDYKAIMNTLTMDDDLLYALATDNGLRAKFDKDLLQEMDNHLAGVMVANGLLERIFDKENQFMYQYLKSDQIICKAAPLRAFNIEAMGFNDIAELNAAICEGKIDISTFKQNAPDLSKEWQAAQKKEQELADEYDNYNPCSSLEPDLEPDNETVELEKIDIASVGTEAYLNAFVENFLPAPESTNKTPDVFAIAVMEAKKAEEARKLSEAQKASAPDAQKAPTTPATKPVQLGLF